VSLHATSAGEVWAALAWGAVSSVGLLVGAIAGSFSLLPHQAIAMAMSVGAGLLLAGVSLKVAADAIRIAGRSYTYIFLLWSAVAIGASAAIAAGYVVLGSLSDAWPPRLQAFGAGALLAMTAETMIPEAFHDSPHFSGLLAAFGFGLLLLVDATTR
jgi:ZIP family zinc transporter